MTSYISKASIMDRLVLPISDTVNALGFGCRRVKLQQSPRESCDLVRFSTTDLGNNDRLDASIGCCQRPLAKYLSVDSIIQYGILIVLHGPISVSLLVNLLIHPHPIIIPNASSPLRLFIFVHESELVVIVDISSWNVNAIV